MAGTAPTKGRGGMSDQRRHRLRLEVSREASRLFWAQGVDATSGDQIAEAVGLSTRTIWRHFRSKESCAEPIVMRGVEWEMSTLRSWPPQLSLEVHFATESNKFGREASDVERMDTELAIKMIRMADTELGHPYGLADGMRPSRARDGRDHRGATRTSGRGPRRTPARRCGLGRPAGPQRAHRRRHPGGHRSPGLRRRACPDRTSGTHGHRRSRGGSRHHLSDHDTADGTTGRDTCPGSRSPDDGATPCPVTPRREPVSPVLLEDRRDRLASYWYRSVTRISAARLPGHLPPTACGPSGSRWTGAVGETSGSRAALAQRARAADCSAPWEVVSAPRWCTRRDHPDRRTTPRHTRCAGRSTAPQPRTAPSSHTSYHQPRASHCRAGDWRQHWWRSAGLRSLRRRRRGRMGDAGTPRLHKFSFCALHCSSGRAPGIRCVVALWLATRLDRHAAPRTATTLTAIMAFSVASGPPWRSDPSHSKTAAWKAPHSLVSGRQGR